MLIYVAQKSNSPYRCKALSTYFSGCNTISLILYSPNTVNVSSHNPKLACLKLYDLEILDQHIWTFQVGERCPPYIKVK